jgi:hypothetical protein
MMGAADKRRSRTKLYSRPFVLVLAPLVLLKTLLGLSCIDGPPLRNQNQQGDTDDNFQRRENQIAAIVHVDRPR